MPQVRADGVRLAVDQLGGELGVVEGLVPELPLGLRGEDPLSDPRQRRGENQGVDQIGRGQAGGVPLSGPVQRGQEAGSRGIALARTTLA